MYMQTPKKQKKVIVFDMDETLGSFVQLGIFTSIIEQHIHRSLSQDEFNIFMDMFPLYQRPNIISILKFLKKEKKEKRCYKIYIYTNNQGPKSWALHIKKYFEDKINYPLFDKVIHAYKVQGEQVEKHRTSHNKSVKDFFKCTNLSKQTSICFLDDQYHHDMLHPNVYYLHLKEYHYNYDPNYMFKTFKEQFNLSVEYINYLQEYGTPLYLEYNFYQRKHQNTNIDYEKHISNIILNELKHFLKKFNNITTRKHLQKQKQTLKVYKKQHYKRIV